MHAEAFAFVQWVASKMGPRHSVLEIGSRNVNGTIRPLFNGSTRYLGIDMLPGFDVDVVANGATYQPSHPVDTVISCEVLEHTPEAPKIVGHALEVLEPGGVLIV